MLTFALGAVAGAGYGLYSCNEREAREWKARTPMCEGPRKYTIERLKWGRDSQGYTYHNVVGKFQAKDGETFKIGDENYTVVGPVKGSMKGGVIIRKAGSDSFDIIATGNDLSRLRDLGFGGWTCDKSEKPKTAARSE